MRIWLTTVAMLSGLAAAPVLAQDPPRFAGVAAPFDPATAPLSARANGAMIPIPAGTYPIGSDEGPLAADPAHTVTLDGFAIDRTEVTNGAFAEFLNAVGAVAPRDVPAGRVGPGDVGDGQAVLLRGGRPPGQFYPLIALDDREARIDLVDGRFVPSPDHGDHPAAETTWAGARAYCEWRGARLPTEVEWEAAARGTDGRIYPWGNSPPSRSKAYFHEPSGKTAPVGTHPDGASPFGVQDMSGGLAEWTSSLERPYPYDATDGREDPNAPDPRVTRGGDYLFDNDPDGLTVLHRDGFSNAPDRGHRHIGFRCARSAAG